MTIPTEGSPPSDPILDGAVETPAVADATAASSAADGKEASKSLRDVLKDVVEPKEPAAQSSAPEAEKKDVPAGEGEAAYAADPETDKSLPFGKHPRFKEVLGQRDAARGETKELREQLAAVTREAEDLRGPAAEFRAIEAFRETNNLSQPEVIDLLKIGALMKSGDAEAALAAIMPHVTALMTATGRTLPPDLAKQVEEGAITETAASELARTRAAASREKQRAETATTTLQSERTQREASNISQEVASATDQWETAARAKDPDFEVKSPFIRDRVHAIAAQEGAPRTPQAAVALAQRAYDDVTRTMRAALPKPQTLRRPAASSPSVEARPAPKTLREALNSAVGR